MTPASTPIAQAVRLLRAAAKDIKDCHTRGHENWAGEPEALAAHDEHIAVAQALELKRAAEAILETALHQARGLAYTAEGLSSDIRKEEAARASALKAAP